MRKKIIKRSRRVVIKVGSAVVAARPADGPDIFTRLADEIKGLKEAGREAAIVSSGAIALGMRRLGMKERPATIPERQAAAAVGQGSLMALYDSAFSKVGEKAAQVLLTHDDLGSRKRFLNARNTLTALFRLGIVPVINENDTVAVEEIKFGDNDALSALATNLVEADLLIILSDIDGLYDKDPKAFPDAKKLALVEDVDELNIDTIINTANSLGTGGIKTKCEAARRAAHYGAATIIANGNKPGIVSRLLAGEEEGTLFLPKEDRLTSKKHWIAFSARPSGRVFVDDGAKEALLNKGRSLLPTGIRDVDGSFDAGEVVHCVDLLGKEFARGVANYSSSEIQKIKGLNTAELVGVLGYKVYDEVIHRDNLVVL
ncbi:MAG TPA: glutamate 5-kinase [Deltaproteobacteria bacterium]|nr:MAG: glutamate 5-kinase [Deltaproteobacteria bacterium GWA2_55_82]OGQ63418.1 MAG: glutamate 5-kinase [Deltaproteobacteria bacterium RIFCSPLOWO2_02_FULL_55_12]OIJ75016.1 MAG: glutamate 5-kinase [Deltaproteobacteria bacterium GWC2_55_46]HBG45533.1 glutamate 5-kinase [Deltaproteobacteria bacterium]HCY10364.1 glutamate 5-kinase [Deltaproteobacteria bacterium]